MIETNSYHIAVNQKELTMLPVMETFYTLQGEGRHHGKAAYFIRLGGCDVGCVWCDVKESWDASVHPLKAIDEIIEEATKNIGYPALSQNPIFVVTGGEPLLHNLDELTEKIQSLNFKTHIETSGSSPLSGCWDWICLSPKKFKAPLDEICKVANELKVIVFNKSDFPWAEQFAAKVSSHCKLYLQPEWSKRNVVTPLIIDYIKKNPQWQFSSQLHKYINIP